MENKSIKEIRKEVGLTQNQFSEMFEIPIDVVKSWDSGRRKPPAWAKKLIIEKLIYLKGKEKGMRTLSYFKGTEQEIKIGAELYFGQIWDGKDGDGEELLGSSSVSPDGENVVAFEIIEEAGDIMDTLVKVTDIY